MTQRITPQQVNLAKATNYKLEITALPGVSFWLTSVSLPDISVNEVPIPDPIHANKYIPSDTVDWEPLQVAFLVDEDFENYHQVYDWLMKMAGPDTAKRDPNLKDLMIDCSLHVLTNNKNASNTVFTFHDVFPIMLGSVEFNNESAEPLQSSMTFQYTSMSMSRDG